MWIGLAILWILGSVTLYVYLFATAKEAPLGHCFDCELTDCTDCPHYEAQAEKKAA
ncbi:MAG: hypothetical protein GX139_12305 [Armatimonadetes bacterium]|jgi:hypothetical protein|nr:hypothetical protein [Armatimonadota bacterium]